MRRRRRLVLAPVVLALGVLAAACGGSSGEDSSGVATAGDGRSTSAGTKDGKKKVDPQQAGLDFARCMREQGVDVPDPKGDGGFVIVGPAPGEAPAGAGAAPPAGFEEAEKKCRHHLQDLIREGGGPVDPKEQDRALAFARCMREHGVNMPDPDFSKGGGVAIKIGEDGMDPSSPTFQAAQKACGSLFGPGGADVAPVPGARSGS